MSRKPFLTAEWRSLAMLNFEIAPSVLQPYVPAGTELDCVDGRTFVSVVGFLFRNTRVLGFSIPGHVHFEEVNLRLYVRRKVGDEWRRGVVFVKELVPRKAIATMARYFYNENYQAVPMRHVIDASPQSQSIRYEWKIGDHWAGMSLQTTGEPSALIAGSHEEFIAEHYYGYGRQRNGDTLEYKVEHPPWRVWANCQASLDADVCRLYPTEFHEPLGRQPFSAFVAEGSPISVSWPDRLNR